MADTRYGYVNLTGGTGGGVPTWDASPSTERADDALTLQKYIALLEQQMRLKQLLEERRQFDAQLGENQRQFDAAYDADRFDQKYADARARKAQRDARKAQQAQMSMQQQAQLGATAAQMRAEREAQKERAARASAADQYADSTSYRNRDPIRMAQEQTRNAVLLGLGGGGMRPGARGPSALDKDVSFKKAPAKPMGMTLAQRQAAALQSAEAEKQRQAALELERLRQGGGFADAPSAAPAFEARSAAVPDEQQAAAMRQLLQFLGERLNPFF